MPTKEQVLRRMAQIEGWVSFQPDPDVWYRKDSKVEFDGEFYCYTFASVDPLDTPSDWAVLIEKHGVGIQRVASSFHKSEVSAWEWEANVGPFCVVAHESLPWAICLAIIESKGGMVDE